MNDFQQDWRTFDFALLIFGPPCITVIIKILYVLTEAF